MILQPAPKMRHDVLELQKKLLPEPLFTQASIHRARLASEGKLRTLQTTSSAKLVEFVERISKQYSIEETNTLLQGTDIDLLALLVDRLQFYVAELRSAEDYERVEVQGVGFELLSWILFDWYEQNRGKRDEIEQGSPNTTASREEADLPLYTPAPRVSVQPTSFVSRTLALIRNWIES